MLKLAVIGGAVLLAVFAAYAVALWHTWRGVLRLSAACGRGWGRACEVGGGFAGRVAEAMERRRWVMQPELVRA